MGVIGNYDPDTFCKDVLDNQERIKKEQKDTINKQKKRDLYYLSIAEAVGRRSKCLSRKIGAVLVKDDMIIATGFNGPPQGIPHCDSENAYFRVYENDNYEYYSFESNLLLSETQGGGREKERLYGDCPRKLAGYGSGKGLEVCPAVHAERNAILTAAANGVSTKGTTLYCFCPYPCADCCKEIINAGIKKIVCLEGDYYDTMSEWLLEKSNIEVITYSIEEISEWLEKN
ncbi:MAG: dCMP deaminase family protein [Phycisphaerae bacterium]|jgi:dCMP deaminase